MGTTGDGGEDDGEAVGEVRRGVGLRATASERWSSWWHDAASSPLPIGSGGEGEWGREWEGVGAWVRVYGGVRGYGSAGWACR